MEQYTTVDVEKNVPRVLLSKAKAKSARKTLEAKRKSVVLETHGQKLTAVFQKEKAALCFGGEARPWDVSQKAASHKLESKLRTAKCCGKDEPVALLASET